MDVESVSSLNNDLHVHMSTKERCKGDDIYKEPSEISKPPSQQYKRKKVFQSSKFLMQKQNLIDSHARITNKSKAIFSQNGHLLLTRS